MEYQVTVQIEGEDVSCGRLFQSVRHGEETTSFIYDTEYLANPSAFALSPDMPLGSGSFHSRGLGDMRAFEDAMPDRWGRNLLLRSERLRAKDEERVERTLFETDFLVGVNDETRQGAMRIWPCNGGKALAPVEGGVPREVSLPNLLDAADLAVEDLDADVRDLIAAGSSLGGARPKASVRVQDGRLCIAKFPKVDEGALEDVGAWERVTLVLMARCGISIPSSHLLRIKGRSVLLLERFDRVGEARIPYISGLTAVQGDDGKRYSYLELAEFIEREGANPERDLPELWRRALFSCVVGNTDNHLRNYGFLRARDGWALSPVFDVNPTAGGGEKCLATGLDFDRPDADPRIALELAEYFRVSDEDAREYACGLAREVSDWQRVARSEGISEASVARMAGNFERGITGLTGVSPI